MAYRPTILARDWLVTTEHYLSAEAGAAVLRDGGNAFAAAAAAILVEGRDSWLWLLAFVSALAALASAVAAWLAIGARCR